MTLKGLEPSAPRLKVVCANQLRHKALIKDYNDKKSLITTLIIPHLILFHLFTSTFITFFYFLLYSLLFFSFFYTPFFFCLSTLTYFLSYITPLKKKKTPNHTTQSMATSLNMFHAILESFDALRALGYNIPLAVRMTVAHQTVLNMTAAATANQQPTTPAAAATADNEDSQPTKKRIVRKRKADNTAAAATASEASETTPAAPAEVSEPAHPAQSADPANPTDPADPAALPETSGTGTTLLS